MSMFKSRNIRDDHTDLLDSEQRKTEPDKSFQGDKDDLISLRE